MRHFVNSVIFEERLEAIPAFYILYNMQNIKHMQQQLDLFEQPIQENETKYFVTWEQRHFKNKNLEPINTSVIKTTCRPMPSNEMYEFIEFLKSCRSYCEWHHITKA